jgi:hypothetical protein
LTLLHRVFQRNSVGTFFGVRPGREERYPTPAQRQKIVAAIYVAGALIDEAAEAHHASGGNTAYASWTTP